MKKTNKHSRQGLLATSIASPAGAIAAFVHRDVLTVNERKQVMTKHFKESHISIKKAFIVAIKHGLGLINKSKAELHRLTVAWLRLGEEKWQLIVATAHDNADVLEIEPQFSRFLSWFRVKYHKLFYQNKSELAW